MSAMTKKEWMEYLEKTWDAAQKEAWSEPQFECPRCGHCCQALEEKQEPFEYWSVAEGWVKIDEVREHFDSVGCGTIYKSAGEGRSPLYTAPPKREWVGLTADEIWKCNKASGGAVEFHICYEHQNVEDFAESIEAKLKEKNA